MVHWSGSKSKRVTRGERRAHIRAEMAQRRKMTVRLAIKAKLDLYGPDSLNREEKEIVRLFPDFFYPPQGSQK